MRKVFAAVIAFVAVAAFAEDDVFPRFIVRLQPFPMCADDAPTSSWDAAACKDFDLDASLFQCAEDGDRSAVALLERRYTEASTYAERIRIGSFLLGRVADDSAMWKELSAYAETLIEHGAGAYCEKHDCEPRDYELLAKQALEEIAGDLRARPLLLRALASSDSDLVNTAILGLSARHDDSSLPAIEKALERFPEQASLLALSLIDFNTEAADCLAMKYLKEDDRDLYKEERAAR